MPLDIMSPGLTSAEPNQLNSNSNVVFRPGEAGALSLRKAAVHSIHSLNLTGVHVRYKVGVSINQSNK